MDHFKFNFLSRGQLGSLSIDKFFLTVLKMLPCYEYFFGNFIFALVAWMFSGIILIGKAPIKWPMIVNDSLWAHFPVSLQVSWAIRHTAKQKKKPIINYHENFGHVQGAE